MINVLCVVTSKNDSERARQLTMSLDAHLTFCEVDKVAGRWRELNRIWKIIESEKWDLIYLEGTGIVGGINVLRAYLSWKQPYLLSSGDPVAGYFSTTRKASLGIVFEAYERALYSGSLGYVGWTPYLTGMALKMGARRGLTLIGVDFDTFFPLTEPEKLAEKQRLGLGAEQLVCGVVGSLNWSDKQLYCYGLELIETLKHLNRSDISFLIVGEGSGRRMLEDSLPAHLKSRVVFTGKLSRADVNKAINAMDIGFVTQTLDQLGNFRLSTKLGEYLACGIPVAMSPVPGFYDYVEPAGWPLPPYHPATRQFHLECAAWLDKLDRQEIMSKAAHSKRLAINYFNYEDAKRKFRMFVQSVLPKEKRQSDA